MPFCEICKNRNAKLFYKIDRYIYYECHNCVTLFLDPKPNLKEITAYYKKSFGYSAGETNEMRIRARAKSILKILKKLNPSGKTLLDIGSGYGFFVDEATKKGFKSTGIEPSKSLYDISIKHLIEIILHTDFQHFYAKKKNNKFDFITIIHTIEHVINPREIIYKTTKLLNPRGVLYIETPNLDSYLFKAEKYTYTFLTPPDHIWLFSQKSFHYLLRKVSEMQIEKISTYSYPEHFMGIVKRMLDVRSKMLEVKNKNKQILHKISNFKPPTSNFSRYKYLLFDQLLAPLITPFLNLGAKGSILELYIRKK